MFQEQDYATKQGFVYAAIEVAVLALVFAWITSFLLGWKGLAWMGWGK
jgi:hypothetical protein